MRTLTALAAVAALSLGLAAPARSQDAAAAWPSKSVRVIVAAAPGGGADFYARILAEGLNKSLGQPFVVENIAGAASVAGAAATVNAPPDGYTMLVTSAGPLSIASALGMKLPYDPTKDLVPVSQLVNTFYAIAVNPKLPVKTVPELVKLLKEEPGKYNYSSSGMGNVVHLATELFLMKSGTKMTHVPYKATGEAVTAVLGGQTDMVVSALTTVLPQFQAGTLRPIATVTAKRLAALPDVPTLNEFYPGTDTVSGAWSGVFVPAGTPPAIIDKMSKAIAAYMKTPDVQDKIIKSGNDPVGSTPAEFAAVVKADFTLAAEIVKAGNIKAE